MNGSLPQHSLTGLLSTKQLAIPYSIWRRAGKLTFSQILLSAPPLTMSKQLASRNSSTHNSVVSTKLTSWHDKNWKAAQCRKKHCDLHTRPQTYAVGSWVWCLDPHHCQGKYWKWQSPYCGPFQIIRQVGLVNYEIKGGPLAKTRIVHIDKLKSCIHSSDVDHLGDSPTIIPHHDDTPVLSRPRRTVTQPCHFRD